MGEEERELEKRVAAIKWGGRIMELGVNGLNKKHSRQSNIQPTKKGRQRRGTRSRWGWDSSYKE